MLTSNYYPKGQQPMKTTRKSAKTAKPVVSHDSLLVAMAKEFAKGKGFTTPCYALYAKAVATLKLAKLEALRLVKAAQYAAEHQGEIPTWI
jgi:hypothetical protein